MLCTSKLFIDLFKRNVWHALENVSGRKLDAKHMVIKKLTPAKEKYGLVNFSRNMCRKKLLDNLARKIALWYSP